MKVIASIAGAGAVLLLAACGSSTSVTPVTSPGQHPTGNRSAASSHAPAAPKRHGIGATYRVKGTDDNDNPVVYKITLTGFKSHASATDEFEAASSGKHLAGAEFRIQAVSGTISDNANNDAQLQGANGQTYSSSLNTITEGTNFSNGDFRVSGSEVSVGWVSFEVPDSVHIIKVQWQPDSGFSGAEAEWTVKH